MLTVEQIEVARDQYAEGMDQLVEELRTAYARSGLSLGELLSLSGLSLHVTTLRRKLIGDGRKKRSKRVEMSPAEAKALAAALAKALIDAGEKLLPAGRKSA